MEKILAYTFLTMLLLLCLWLMRYSYLRIDDIVEEYKKVLRTGNRFAKQQLGKRYWQHRKKLQTHNILLLGETAAAIILLWFIMVLIRS